MLRWAVKIPFSEIVLPLEIELLDAGCMYCSYTKLSRNLTKTYCKQISLERRRYLGKRHVFLLKGEDFGQCPVCCISSEVKKSPSHCTLESCSVTSWLCGTRHGNSFYSTESCDGWKAGPWWRSSVQSLFLAAAFLLLDYLSHFYLSSRQATNKKHPWTPVPPLTAVASFWLFLISVILVPRSHKVPGTSENQALLMATQSFTLSQTHHLLLALEFTNGTLKMKRAAEKIYWTPEHALTRSYCKHLFSPACR